LTQLAVDFTPPAEVALETLDLVHEVLDLVAQLRHTVVVMTTVMVMPATIVMAVIVMMIAVVMTVRTRSDLVQLAPQTADITTYFTRSVRCVSLGHRLSPPDQVWVYAGPRSGGCALNELEELLERLELLELDE